MELRRRLVRALSTLGVVIVVATIGWHLFARGTSWLDALYMVMITISGIGYTEIVDTAASPGLRVFNILVLVSGIGTMVYVVALATAVFVEGSIGVRFRRRRMERKIAGFSGHVIVCGAGEIGSLVVHEIQKAGTAGVLVDLRADRLDPLPEDPRLATIEGDATDLDTLERAGLARAATVVAALPHEKDNLIVTVLVRQRDPRIRIVARHVDPAMGDRMRKAGADAIVSPTSIGGMRLASEAIRPHVVGFLDHMLQDRTRTVRIEEIHVRPGSGWIGKGLGSLELRSRYGLTSLALRDSGDAPFRYGPGPEEILESGAILVVLGEVDRVAEARTAAGH